MIKEAYVSFEVAKLLKEKGFNCKCRAYYIESEQMGVERFIVDREEDYNHSETHPWLVSCPTLQTAMAWLREEKKIYISLYALCDIPEEGNIPEKIMYTYSLLDASEPFHFFDEYDECQIYNPQFDSYEETVNAALLHTLKNLI